MNEDINIQVLEQSLNLIKQIYFVTDKKEFTDSVLKEALRKSVISINANISEAAERSSLNEIKHFLKSANGALSKLKSHTAAAKTTGFINEEDLQLLLKLIENLSRILYNLINT